MSAVLSKVAILEELGSAGRETLSDFLESRSYDAGFLLFQQGQEAAELIVIAEGRVVLRQGGNDIARVEAGECLGGVSLLVIGHRECEAAAEGPVEVLSLTDRVARSVPVGRLVRGTWIRGYTPPYQSFPIMSIISVGKG